MLKENLDHVEEEIRKACERSGRSREEVTLIAVSKTKPVSMLEEAYGLGVRVFGENKVQELVEKYDALPEDIEWHMIGHLQRNKIKYIIGKAALIHSVDSLRLAEAIDKEAAKQNTAARILIEVNVAREESKFGLMPEAVPEFVDKVSEFAHLKVEGLMTIADIAKKNAHNTNMSVLSMGMTNDYQVAVEEGATMVRVGTGIFGERSYAQTNAR